MLRLIHNQTVLGAFLVDDIDDGLPNKTNHRLGSEADPHAYARDGYAKAPKQPCYVPYTKPHYPTIKGYIDLYETERVLHSAGKGKIKGFVTGGKITVVSFQETDLATPTLASAVIDGGTGDMTITGTKLLSLTPNKSSVVITGVGAVTLSQDVIASFTDTEIILLTAQIVGVTAGTSFVKVVADDNTSNQVTAS
jgi:hypothetical protein